MEKRDPIETHFEADDLEATSEEMRDVAFTAISIFGCVLGLCLLVLYFLIT